MQILRPPSVPLSVITAHLQQEGSPMPPEAVWAVHQDGLDPAIALAFFHHESLCGTRGWGRVNANPGNLKLDRKGHGGFHTFASPGKSRGDCFSDGVYAWRRRILDNYVARGLTTVEAIVPVYAPRSDGNDPDAYVNAIYRFIQGLTAATPGRYPAAQWMPINKHFTAGAVGGRSWPSGVDTIVMHHTVGTWQSAIAAWTGDRDASAHLIVRRDGVVVQCVDLNDIAWHAGDWDVNVRSVGIEHEHYIDGGSWSSWTEEQLNASARLIRWLWDQAGHEMQVLRHRDIVATACPGDLPVEDIVNRARSYRTQ